MSALNLSSGCMELWLTVFLSGQHSQTVTGACKSFYCRGVARSSSKNMDKSPKYDSLYILTSPKIHIFKNASFLLTLIIELGAMPGCPQLGETYICVSERLRNATTTNKQFGVAVHRGILDEYCSRIHRCFRDPLTLIIFVWGPVN